MSHRFQRAQKRLDRFATEMRRVLGQPLTGKYSDRVVNEQMENLFREISRSPEKLLPLVERCLGPKPVEEEAAEKWEQVMAMAQQIVAPSLSAKTPGSVHRRHYFGDPTAGNT